ncbi:MAG: Methyl-accepting chemotaxis protein McpB [Pelotomaculum sp. PtaB.Bin013]|uniref:Methyl-accepting chemotaxis protein n=1 Tax=Pelotomaculum isophthalicicum JI TaxID=947010 RepID=A0A9X4GXP7_9FIRM|nr:methyl-accepting chemotaxis protein [Pelotomaculum isophthalicicum]MDF9407012.1 methyl-accepting chemotaxis protein [Pelotomaculum isophthalicicum JI]OPX90803.1 MAG: Methyl-accepting chemotaxis protein McpB [Pelotomaculum sp. PtaB.Bin013]
MVLATSIKLKLMVIIFFVLATALGALSYLSYYKARQALISNTKQDLNSLSAAYGKEVSLWLEQHKTEMITLANSPVIAGGNRSLILSYFNDELKRLKNYESLLIVDGKGDYYSADGTTGNVSDRDYYKQTLSTGQAVISDPLMSRVTGKLVVVAAAPIKKDYRVTGLVLGTLPIDEIVQEISSIKIGKTGYAIMVQGDGLCITHPNKDSIMKLNLLKDNSLHPNLITAAQKMTKGESGVTRCLDNGVDEFLAYAPVPSTNWSLAITSPLADLSSSLRSLAAMAVILTLLILLISAFIAVALANKIVKPIRFLNKEISLLAEQGGDLTQSIHIQSKDETGELARSVNEFLGNLREIISEVKETAVKVAGTSRQLNSSARQTAAGASETASTLSEITAAVEQVTANMQNIAEASESASGHANEGNKGVLRITGQMQNIADTAVVVSRAIDELNLKSKEISQIIGLITNIAGQTNLLALNAAIEAARAGEHGRGFAVVADEVRKLAAQSASAAKQINSLISSMRALTEQSVESMSLGSKEVEAGIKVVQEVGGNFRVIIGAVHSLTSQIQDVAAAMEEMSAGMQNIAAATQEQTATMGEVSASAESLSRLSCDLDDLVGKFKV